MNEATWFYAAIRMATDIQRAEYLRQLGTKKKLKRFVPDPNAVALAHAAHAGDEVETKRLMHVIRCGAYSLV